MTEEVMEKLPWLPEIICLNDFFGDWKSYLDEIYQYFLEDFVKSNPYLDSKIVKIAKDNKIDNKEESFWHLIQEGTVESERIPDMRRCERIRWPKPIIENNKDSKILIWEVERKKGNHKNRRLCLWLKEHKYIVVLAIKKDCFLIITAYCPDRNHRIRKLEKEYQDYKKTSAAF